MSEWGVLLINLGTPEKPEPGEVGHYLKEFLLDPEVIDIPWLPRQLLVRGLIVPFRKKRSALLYQKIWTQQGSPLAIHTQNLADAVTQKLQSSFEAKGLTPPLVKYAYRYGSPSIASALNEFENKKVQKLLILPLYPQYATSATRTCERLLEELNVRGRFQVVNTIQSFHDQDFYLQSTAQMIRERRIEGSHVLFSFHGIPVRQVQKNHSGCSPCLQKDVCHKLGDTLCYRRQCTETAEGLAALLGLSRQDWSMSYQSRLGREEWLLPNTEHVLRDLPARGVKSLTVVCPGFVADCLETLEEMDGQGREIFEHAGGTAWVRVPCLNTESVWVNELSKWLTAKLGSNSAAQHASGAALPS